MIQKIRNSTSTKIFAVFLAFSLFTPELSFALTSGPSQPEVQSFAPITVSDMVDPFTGDFSYNIPLMDVGGAPLNLIYNSGISTDQEASWVGLGWNINPGVINRNMRGVPDDFKGETIKKTLNMKPNRTYHANLNLSAEALGFEKTGPSIGLGIRWNNYSGLGFDQSINISVNLGAGGKGPFTGGLGIRSSTDGGLSLSPSISFQKGIQKLENTALNLSLGGSFNSRAGLSALSFSKSVVKTYQPSGNNRPLFFSSGTNTSISLGTPTFIPTVSMPMKNHSVSLSAKAGLTAFGLDGTGSITGGYSSQSLAVKNKAVPSYGFMYAQDGQHTDDVIMDFNRENDIPYTENTPALPITNFTYDVYSVQGHGISGTFRPFRSDVGYVFDQSTSTTSSSSSLGIELAGGNLVHGGAEISTNIVNTTTGKWRGNNLADNKLVFRGKYQVSNAQSALYEPFYFKQVGEKSVEADPLLFASYGESDAIAIALEHAGGYEIRATDKFIRGDDENTQYDLPNNNFTTQRQRRNQLMQFLTKEETDNAFGLQNLPIANEAAPHHMAEISVVREDGARYVYGMPLYNTQQKEVSFNISHRSPNCETGLVNYVPGKDNSVDNERGLDNFYSATEIKPYAHSYLLTAILSADYIDLTGDGPTPDDFGDYKLFNYASHASGKFQWRVPVTANKANFNEGLKSDLNDDKASYLYGQKEVKYLSTIETKNYIAIFERGDRADGHGVSSENGGISTSTENTMQLLKKISLYSRPDYFLPGTTNINSNAVPIKEVHFTYDYSLCLGITNNDMQPTDPNGFTNQGGKLTLKTVSFTYGKSKKGRLSPYQFTYSSNNPDYNLKGYNRWGEYMPNIGNGCATNDPLTTAEFPYVDQRKLPTNHPQYDANRPNKTFADVYAESWNLTQIDLPSGGTVNIDYESDDYGYVQDKQAMQMFKVVGMSNDANTNNIESLLIDGNQSNLYLFFDLQGEDPADLSAYINGIDDLYFRFLVDMTISGDYEYVSGYAEIDRDGSGQPIAGVAPGTGYGYVKLKSIKQGSIINTQVNPIAKAAWQFGRLNTPRKVWEQPELGGEQNGIEHVVKALTSSNIVSNFVATIKGPNKALSDKGFGKRFIPEKSWVRLNHPTKTKKGGNLRVRRVAIADNWGAMAQQGNGTVSYGQEYDYTMQEDGVTISSGVAAYEPLIGGDENPFKQPIAFGDKREKLLVPDDEHYLTAPLGESFFPEPTVGYRKVTIKNLQYQNVKQNATGSVVQEFYTAFDFPTIVRTSKIMPRPTKTKPLLGIFSMKSVNNMTTSQGFAIELNDMHGKPKAQWVYAEDKEDAISGVQYTYQARGKALHNEVTVIHKNGNITNTNVGVEYDIVGDMREQSTNVTSPMIQGNLATFLVGIFPLAIPTVFPSFNTEKTRFRSAVMTKVIRKYGILESTTAFDLGSKVTTKNLAYDGATGEVLVTETINDYEDPIYSLKYPAHWAYDGMGQAYQNIGATRQVDLDDVTTNPENYFSLGDELIVDNSTMGWVTALTPGTNGSLTVVDDEGTAYTGTKNIKVMRSGRKNQHSTSIGTLTLKTNPLTTFSKNIFEKVLQAETIEFSDYWLTFCECAPEDANGDMVSNPYLTGLRGNWRPKRSLLYLTDRVQTRENENVNIREDGFFERFSPFWQLNSNGSQWMQAPEDWVFTSEVTTFSPYGFELENKDALDRYSAAVYGYNNTLPVAVASNARYQETAFDNFEDYDYKTCDEDHFSYKNNEIHVSTSESHTGKRSISVPPGETIEITKTIRDECEE